MSDSPCTTGRTADETVCPFLHQDKNDEPCLNCQAKLEYAVKQGMLHPEVLNKEEDPIIKEAREEVPVTKKKKKRKCKDCGRVKPIKARGKCGTCYGRWKYRNPDKVRPYSKVASGEQVKCFDVRLQAGIDKNSEKYKLLQRAAEIAHLKYRTVQNQVFYWIKEGIEREK